MKRKRYTPENIDLRREISLKKILVIGLGGVGIHALGQVPSKEGTTLLAIDTDAALLSHLPLSIERFPIGLHVARGLGTGGSLERGREALLEDKEKLLERLKQIAPQMVFLCAGTGGGTGGGGALILADMLRDLGIPLRLTILIDPFGENFEEKDSDEAKYDIWKKNGHAYMPLAFGAGIPESMQGYCVLNTVGELFDLTGWLVARVVDLLTLRAIRDTGEKRTVPSLGAGEVWLGSIHHQDETLEDINKKIILLVNRMKENGCKIKNLVIELSDSRYFANKKIVNDLQDSLGVASSTIVVSSVTEVEKPSVELLVYPEWTWREPVTGMEFVWVPPGRFMMGSPETEKARGADEGPQHWVELDGFWLGRYPVTQGEWTKIMGKNPSHFPKGNRYPVENVSWNMTQEFIAKLFKKECGKFRLPTEAEWEYGCRAGTTTPFYFGATISADTQANYDGNHPYGQGDKGIYRRSTTEVGSFPENGFGLYDMHGNVWEWCEDWYAEKFYREEEAIQKNCLSKNRASGLRVLRGGSWVNNAWNLRSANRDGHSPDDRNFNVGFRLVRLSQD